MTAKEDVKGTTTYTYTSNNQLATVNEPTGKQTTYTYDAADNRQSEVVTENGQSIETWYEVDEQNSLEYTKQALTRSGNNAQTIIEQLNALGYFGLDGGPLTVDGKFGPNTEFAVKIYQENLNKAGISYTPGVVDAATWNHIFTKAVTFEKMVGGANDWTFPLAVALEESSQPTTAQG